jgi:hypothetical protein
MFELEKRDTGQKSKRWTNSHEDITNLDGLHTVAAADNHVKGRRLKKHTKLSDALTPCPFWCLQF